MAKFYARHISLAAGSAAALVCALILSGQTAQAAPPSPPDAATARTYLAEIKKQAEGPQDGYSRDKFPHWIDQGGSCNTREVVLKRDGTDVEQDGSCAATSGTWVSAYDGATWTQASDLDIDHVIPLSEAWKSGAADWTTERRQQLANDLAHSQLIAVTDNVNQEKGDQDPAEWLPPQASYHCEYARMWVWVKHAYGMTADSAEKAALTKILDGC
ncbi:HNH endonuclease family protein [Streptomyces halobius]|uniref:HNH endonuclease family protein n=1 Tax=Streptomyces halobius TaxID=2879846 RepID=A0ABY4ME62_9ACTN|nr:HNH endonuclease family protein [Streptomyces halobius]UQA95763.1 HNH endonuclease family protein [Streptomyces halobius]